MSVLDRISSVQVEYPLMFRVQNAAMLMASHCGVLEFVIQEGFVHMPSHTMARITLRKDEDELVLLTSTSLPNATSVKLWLHTMDFSRVEVSQGAAARGHASEGHHDRPSANILSASTYG
ncbi:putative ubiquitin fusion degradation protein [Hordeum vulgare]|nr:putative ubiquitin fusion degradation protein [Hordeum vulgare]